MYESVAWFAWMEGRSIYELLAPYRAHVVAGHMHEIEHISDRSSDRPVGQNVSFFHPDGITLTSVALHRSMVCIGWARSKS